MNNVGMRLRYPTLICLHQKYAQHALAGRSKREGGRQRGKTKRRRTRMEEVCVQTSTHSLSSEMYIIAIQYQKIY